MARIRQLASRHFTKVALLKVLLTMMFVAPVAMALDPDRTLTFRTSGEILSFDPAMVQDTTTSAIARDLFEGLFNQDENGELQPGVATRFEANEDNTIFLFHLRDNAKWSDGTQVTAHDFVHAWRRVADPATESPYSWYLESMAILNAGKVIEGAAEPEELGVTALDDLTLEILLAESLSYFPKMTVFATTFPVHRHSIERHGSNWIEPAHIVSNGAYVLSEFEPGEKLVMTRNPNYWDDANTGIDAVVIKTIHDSGEALNAYLAGELDMVDVPAGRFEELHSLYPDEIHSVPTLCSIYYVFNLSASMQPAFGEPAVRRALSLAIDREHLTENVLKSGSIPTYTLTPGTISGFDVPDLPIADMTQIERNHMAMELLETAGFGPDRPLEFTVLSSESDSVVRMVNEVARQWETRLGARVATESVAWGEYLERLLSQDFEIARTGWCGDYNEASTFLDLVTSRSDYNSGRYLNEDVDRMMSDARRMEDPREIYAEVEVIIERDVPVIPLYNIADSFLLDPRVTNWPFNNIEGNWYTRNLGKLP